MKDRVLVAGLIGGLSVLSGEIVTAVLVWAGLGEYRVFELNSLVVTINRPSFWMGLLVNFIIGVQVGVAFYLVFKWLGAEHVVIKCTVGSMILWFAFELVFTTGIEGKDIPLRAVSDYYVHAIGTAAYGATVGALMKACLFRHSA